MSQPDKAQNITSLPESPSTDETLVEKQPNALKRAWHKIKSNPKTTFAVIGGVALVGVGAALGRSSAPYHVEIVEDEDVEPAPVLVLPQSDDTQSA